MKSGDEIVAINDVLLAKIGKCGVDTYLKEKLTGKSIKITFKTIKGIMKTATFSSQEL